MKKADKADSRPLVYKEQEFADFLSLVQQGLWRNNKLLAEVCSVEEETIAKWKKMPEVVNARRVALADTLTTFKNRGDVEKRLKEQGMEFDPDKVEAKLLIEMTNINDV